MSLSAHAQLKVGVTLHIRNGTQSLWENGIFQNCLFLVMLLERVPHVGKVYLVHGGDGTPEQREQKKLEAQQAFTVVSEEIHAISQLLRAYSLYEKDVEYVVQDGKVMIEDGQGNVATVTSADVKQSNGVIHVIDKVLLPAG